MICKNFDPCESNDCSNGYYATDIDGLIYTNLSGNSSVFEMEMGGLSVISDTYKQRFESQVFIREIPIDEVKELVSECSKKMEWDYFKALFPTNPFTGELKEVTAEILSLFKEWASVRDSVSGSVWGSVWNSVSGSVWGSGSASVSGSGSALVSASDSVWDSVSGSVRASVWDSVSGSVRDSVNAYISSIFPNIKKWKYINHEKGKNPFQSAVTLWEKGFVVSFDGEFYRLHSGSNAEIVYTVSAVELLTIKSN